MASVFPCVLFCDCLWKVFTHADKRPWGLQEADAQLEECGIKAGVATVFLSIHRIHNAPSSPSALCVSHRQHLTASFFSLSQPVPRLSLQPTVFMENPPEVTKASPLLFSPPPSKRGATSGSDFLSWQWQRGG